MKAILNLIQEQKAQAIIAIEQMKQARAEYDAQCDKTYPVDGTYEDRIAYCNENDRIRKAEEDAVKAAGRKVIALGSLLGLQVDAKEVSWWFFVERAFNDVLYYVEEVERHLNNTVENYNRFH